MQKASFFWYIDVLGRRCTEEAPSGKFNPANFLNFWPVFSENEKFSYINYQFQTSIQPLPIIPNQQQNPTMHILLIIWSQSCFYDFQNGRSTVTHLISWERKLTKYRIKRACQYKWQQSVGYTGYIDCTDKDKLSRVIVESYKMQVTRSGNHCRGHHRDHLC